MQTKDSVIGTHQNVSIGTPSILSWTVRVENHTRAHSMILIPTYVICRAFRSRENARPAR